jgi:hypothetical protein
MELSNCRGPTRVDIKLMSSQCRFYFTGIHPAKDTGMDAWHYRLCNMHIALLILYCVRPIADVTLQYQATLFALPQSTIIPL